MNASAFVHNEWFLLKTTEEWELRTASVIIPTLHHLNELELIQASMACPALKHAPVAPSEFFGLF